MAASDVMKAAEASIERVILDPRYHDILTLVKGIRNGIVYGTKVRFPHALVMIFLFRHGSLRSKIRLIFKATRTHARNLGLFALIYKSTLLGLRQLRAKEGPYDTFLAGLLGGYYVFGRYQSAVNQQIVIYVFARVMLALAKLVVQPRGTKAQLQIYGDISEGAGGWGLIRNERLREMVERNAWPVFASLSWAAVMYIFRWHPESVQPSLRSSMQYIYVDSNHWDSLKNFIWHNK